jgi:hypothetical protein
MIALLNEHNVKFDSFDILCDEEVRQGMIVRRMPMCGAFFVFLDGPHLYS